MMYVTRVLLGSLHGSWSIIQLFFDRLTSEAPPSKRVFSCSTDVSANTKDLPRNISIFGRAGKDHSENQLRLSS